MLSFFLKFWMFDIVCYIILCIAKVKNVRKFEKMIFSDFLRCKDKVFISNFQIFEEKISKNHYF